MKKLFILFYSMIFWIPMIIAQTNIDKLTETLDSLTAYSFNNWRISPDLSQPVEGNPASPGFNDSGWKILKVNEKNYEDSCWLRKEIILPETILGKPVKGKINFLVSVDDYGYFFVNGENKGYFPWDGEFTLTENARPGEKFLIAIKALIFRFFRCLHTLHRHRVCKNCLAARYECRRQLRLPALWNRSASPR